MAWRTKLESWASKVRARAAVCTSPETSPAIKRIECGEGWACNENVPEDVNVSLQCQVEDRFSRRIFGEPDRRWRLRTGRFRLRTSRLHYIIDIFRFGAPYLRRYWLAFVLGITFRRALWLSNGAVVWGTKTILDRFNPPLDRSRPFGFALGDDGKSDLHEWSIRGCPASGRPIDGGKSSAACSSSLFSWGYAGWGRYLAAICMASMGEREL